MLNTSWGRYALILLPMMMGAVGCGGAQKSSLYPDFRVRDPALFIPPPPTGIKVSMVQQ